MYGIESIAYIKLWKVGWLKLEMCMTGYNWSEAAYFSIIYKQHWAKVY